MLVAVYGTLKKGFGNHHVISDSKFIGTDYLKFDKLYDCGFPCVKFNNNSDKEILVELYEVETDEGMQRLDWLEGVPTLYHRLYTKTISGKDVCVYEYTRDIEGIDYKVLKKIGKNKYNRIG